IRKHDAAHELFEIGGRGEVGFWCGGRRGGGWSGTGLLDISGEIGGLRGGKRAGFVLRHGIADLADEIGGRIQGSEVGACERRASAALKTIAVTGGALVLIENAAAGDVLRAEDARERGQDQKGQGRFHWGFAHTSL